MGSYAPQGYGSSAGGASGAILPTTGTAEDEAITVTVTMANVLSFRLNQTVDTIITMKNTDAVKTLDFIIWGSPKDGVSAPIDADDSWYNILNQVSTPSDYNASLSKTIPALGIHRESLSNRFGWIRVQMKNNGTGTLTAKAWLRSTTP